MLFVIAILGAVLLSFSLRALLAKSNRLRNLFLVLLFLVGLTWFIPYIMTTQVSSFARFYNFLIVTALANFLVLIYVLSLIFLMLWEWLFPVRAPKSGKDHQKSIRLSNLFAAILAIIGCVILIVAVWATLPSILQDILLGAQFKTGVIEQVILRAGTTSFTGFIVVEGVTYQIPDHAWFSSLSNGQPISLIYGLFTHYGFIPTQVTFTLLGAIVLILLLCPLLVIWGAALYKVIFLHKGK